MAHRRKGHVRCVIRTHASKTLSGSVSSGTGELTTHTYYKNCKGLRPGLKEGEVKALKVFAKACELADLPTTQRQLNKWANKKGLAYTFIRKAKAELKNG